MTDPHQEDETTATSMESLTWPDPSRPIINQQPPGYGGPTQGRPMPLPRPQVGHGTPRSFRPVLLGVALGIVLAVILVVLLVLL